MDKNRCGQWTEGRLHLGLKGTVCQKPACVCLCVVCGGRVGGMEALWLDTSLEMNEMCAQSPTPGEVTVANAQPKWASPGSADGQVDTHLGEERMSGLFHVAPALVQDRA